MADNHILDKTKIGDWALRRLEDKVRPFLAAQVPPWIETYHLTFSALIWTIGVIISAYLAQYSLNWLWLSCLFILLHYLTDFLDGTIGRIRNTGLIKWGYYMDHFLDYIFFTALILSYSFILPAQSHMILIVIMLLQIGFMINIFLLFATTNELAIAFGGIGPSEIRILYVLFNIFLIFFGPALPVLFMPYGAIVMAVILAINVSLNQRKIWQLDMDIKNKTSSAE